MASRTTAGTIARITKEIAQIHQAPDLSLAVACHDADVHNVRALIIGPPDTPGAVVVNYTSDTRIYEYGFFEFEIQFGEEYPIKSPTVRATTTNSGQCRFNPNIYHDGKVCLSILGTWHGRPGEEWSSAQGLESVRLSIQSLMSDNPYENEPGCETARKDEPMPAAYIAKIRHETLRIAVIQRLEGLLNIASNDRRSLRGTRRADRDAALSWFWESKLLRGAHGADGDDSSSSLDSKTWDPFADVIKRRFLWYYDTYVQIAEREAKKHAAGKPFASMDFEYKPNTMEGSFAYDRLLDRLDRIHKRLNEEQAQWATAGAQQVADGTPLASQLAFHFKQLKHATGGSRTRIEISLPDPHNVFVWSLTLFGRPMTNLDGGVFNMILHIPPTFPGAQPRVQVTTPVFHLRVSPRTGTLCYLPAKDDDITAHLDAISAAFEEDDPTYDPRAVVNPEAFALYWGGSDQRKLYHRRLRRSAQESCGS